MKLFVLSPFADTMFDPPLKQAPDAAGEVIAITRLDDWSTLAASFAEPGDKVIAIDPRFCNWTVPSIVLDKERDTRAICLQTTSFSWVDVAHARARGISVTNTRDFSTIAVAEWATMMVLLVARRIPLIIAAGNQPQFTPDTRGIELRGRVAGIVGLGRIGTALAENMAGLGMDVQYWSRSSVDARFRKVTLEELMRSSDVVLPAIAKNDQTNRLLDDTLVRSMKPSAIFVSVVHDVYDHTLLLDRVARGDLFGYGFEHSGLTSPTGNVWAGPQMAWFTEESVARNTQGWVNAIVAAAAGRFPTQIN